MFGWWTVVTAAAGGRQEREIERLEELQLQAQRAHLGEDPALLVSTFAPDLVMVDDGEVRPVTKEAAIERFTAYFDQVEFLAWEDAAPPRIAVSRDLTLATVVVEKDVRIRYLDEVGQPAEEHTRFAWVETWARRNGRWELTIVASTDRPGG